MEARTKIEQEIESHTLQTEVRLSDNSKGKVFIRNPRNEAGHFVYSCNVCGVASLPGETCLVRRLAMALRLSFIHDFIVFCSTANTHHR